MRVNWFEIPVADMPRAIKFYSTIFQITFDSNELGGSEMAFFPSDETEQGSTGTLIKYQSYIPSHQGALVYFSVPEINEVVPRIASAGGKVINEKMSIGEHGFVAHFEDSEGNRVALHQTA